MSDDRPVFIFDAANVYIRAYCAYPQLTPNGDQIGGCVGFLKTLQKLCREYQPSKVYIAWEGGGSQRRRKLFPDYKLNRKPGKLNRFYDDDIPDSEDNKQKQMITLINILKCMPVCQLYVSDVEGDDIIAYLCRGPLRNMNRVIVSSDKDMYQLLDDKTKIYSLHKKRFVTDADLFEEFRIRSHNFALAKCLCGDDSDNIPGIKGMGFKTAAKKFPMLGSDETIILQDLLNFAASHSEESLVYKRVTECVGDVKRNWQLVHLDGSMLSADQTKRIDHAVDTFVPTVDKIGTVRRLIAAGITDFDVERFFYEMLSIEGIRYSSGKT